MDDDKKKQPEVEEVVTQVGDVRIRSGFEVEEVSPGVVSFNLLGPVFEFPDDDEGEEDLDLDDDEEEGDDQP